MGRGRGSPGNRWCSIWRFSPPVKKLPIAPPQFEDVCTCWTAQSRSEMSLYSVSVVAAAAGAEARPGVAGLFSARLCETAKVAARTMPCVAM